MTIEQEGVYIVLLAFCNETTASLRADFVVEARTPYGQLPTGIFPLLFTQPLLFIFYVILIIFWCKKSFDFRKYLTVRFLIVLLILQCIFPLLAFIYLLVVNNSGHIYQSHIIFLLILYNLINGIAYGVYLLMSVGWVLYGSFDSIGLESWRYQRFIISLFFSMLWHTLPFLVGNLQTLW